MRFQNWQPKYPVHVALALAVVTMLAGCDSGFRTPSKNPPADTVTFPQASTQGWLQQYGTGYMPSPRSHRNGDSAYGVATDFQGNVIVVDQTYGAFPGFSSNNLAQFAVVKFDSGGNRMWTQQFGTGMGDFPNAIATDAQGDIFVGGSTKGAFPGFTNTNGILQNVVIKLNPAGQVLWTQQFPSPGSSTGPSQATSLATDAQSNVVVGGNYKNSQNYLYGYITKLAAADGSTIWTQSGSSNLNVTGVGVDGQGDVIAVGAFKGTGSNTVATYMVTKLNGANGQTTWLQQPLSISPYGTQNQVYTQVAVDAQGDIFVDGLNISTGWGQCTVAKLDNGSGSQVWQQSFGAAQLCIPGGVAVDTAGNVLMTGGTIYPFFSNSNQNNDVFLAKLNTGGQAVWLQQFGTGLEGAPGYTSTNALMFVATDGQNNALIAGTTAGAFPGFTNPNGTFQLIATQFGQ